MVGLIYVLAKQSPWTRNPAASLDDPREHLSSPDITYHAEPDLGQDAMDESNFPIDTEATNEQPFRARPARWGHQDVMPDIIQAPTGVPLVPQEKVVKVTAAEAQLTLQMFLGKLTWQEKMMVLKLLTKFSPSEMLEVFQLYKQGSRQAYRNLDAIVMAKVSEADFEKLRALVNKYR